RPDPGRVEVIDRGFADAGERGVARIFAGVEAIGVAGFGQEALSSGWIVRITGRLPVELEAARDDAPGDPGISECLGLIDRVPVDGVVRGQAHAPVVPG